MNKSYKKALHLVIHVDISAIAEVKTFGLANGVKPA